MGERAVLIQTTVIQYLSGLIWTETVVFVVRNRAGHSTQLPVLAMERGHAYSESMPTLI